jgi:hypothetical protein
LEAQQYHLGAWKHVIAIDSDVWQHEDDMITDLFQPPKDDLLQHSHDDFCSYPGGFDIYSFEHLDLLYKENFQPSLCSNFDEGKDMIFPKQNFCDETSQPYPFSPCFSTIYMVGSSTHNSHLPMGQSCFQPMVCCGGLCFHTNHKQTSSWEQKFFFRPGYIPYLAPFAPIDNHRTFRKFLRIPSSGTFGDSFVAEDEDLPSSDFIGLVLGWIGKGCGDTPLHDFVPPSHLYELDFMIGCAIMTALTHDLFGIDLSLCWCVMKHKGRCSGTMLGWLYWLYDYT